jgi:hypothetical protein
MVLLAGGAGPGTGTASSLEFYLVAEGRFVIGAGSLFHRRIRHSATLLAHSSQNLGFPVVLVFGGELVEGSDPAEELGLSGVSARQLRLPPILIPFVRDQAAVITAACNVFAFGGTTDVAGQNPSDLALWYADQSTPTVRTVFYNFFDRESPMPSPRSLHGAVNIAGNRFLIVDGVSRLSPEVSFLGFTMFEW